MKRILLFFLCCAFVLTASAQSYTIEPANTTLITGSMDPTDYQEFYYKLHNGTNGTLNLQWELISGVAPAGMNIAVCDWRNCFIETGAWPQGREMEPLPRDTFAPLKVQMSPGGLTGLAQACYKVWDLADPNKIDTLCFEIDIVLGQDEDLSDRVNVFPSPARNFIGLEATHGTLPRGEARLFDLNGREVRSESIPARSLVKINLQGLTPGIYWLRYDTEEGKIVKKVVKM